MDDGDGIGQKHSRTDKQTDTKETQAPHIETHIPRQRDTTRDRDRWREGEEGWRREGEEQGGVNEEQSD